MKKHYLVVLASVFSLSILINGSIHAQGSPSAAKVTGWGMHYGGQVVYRYQVQNLGQLPIKQFIIGLYQPLTEDGRAELSVLPKKHSSSFWLPQNIALRPNGWGAKLVFPEESETFAIEWVEAGYYKEMWPAGGKGENAPVAQMPPIVIPPQGALDTFSVTLPETDFSYVNGHASIDYGDQTLAVPIQKGDSIPPTISLNVNRENQNEDNGNWAIFDVEASAKDNYDPSPTLILNPVLSNQPLQIGDAVVNIKRGGWKIKLKNVVNRTYQLKFTSQDASGNTSVKTFDYVVAAHKKNKDDHDRDNT